MRLISPYDYARSLKVTRQKICKDIKAGKLPVAECLGTTLVIVDSEVAEPFESISLSETYIDTIEAARMLNCGVSKIIIDIHIGTIPGVKVGGKFFIPKKQFQSLFSRKINSAKVVSASAG